MYSPGWGRSAGYFKARLVNVGFPFVYLGSQYFPWHALQWSQNVGNQAREKINALWWRPWLLLLSSMEKTGIGGAGGTLSVSMGVPESFQLFWHLLNSRDGGKRKLAASAARGPPGSPVSTLSVDRLRPHWMPLYRWAILNFSKILCRSLCPRCLWQAGSASFQGCWLKNPPRNLRKTSPLGISRGWHQPPFCFLAHWPQAT